VMPSEAVSALNVIAITLAIQTLLMVGGFIAAIVVWRRVAVQADRRIGELGDRLDDVLRETRQAAQAVGRMSSHADGLLGGTESVVRTLATVVAPSRALLAAGAASVASRLLLKWRRRRTPAA
jgi:hypothetical protein